MKKLMITLLCAAFGGAQVLFSTEVKFVDYVESTGSQYVDLGIVGRPGMRLTTKMLWVEVPYNGGYVSARNGSTRFYPLQSYPSKWGFGYGGNYSGSAPKANTVYDVVSVLKKGEQTLMVDGVTNVTNTLTSEPNTKLNLYLFASNYSGPANYSKARCYSLKIETNAVDGAWVAARDLRPITVEGETAGALYDMVSGRIFRSNASTPLVASATARQVASVEHQGLTAEGTVDFQVAVDGMFTPCALSAVVSNTVTGVTTTKPLGTVEDSDVHAYQLSDLSPDGKYVVAIRGTWPGEGGETRETDLATISLRRLTFRAMTLHDSLVIRFAGNVPGSRLLMAYGAVDAGNNPDDWDKTVDRGTLQTDEGCLKIPFPDGWGDTVRAARFFITDEDGPDIAARSDTAAPVEVKSFSSLSYVTNGLIAQWDAIENAGRGVHSDNPASWTELVGGIAVSKSENLSYGKDAVWFNGADDHYFTCNIPALKTALANKSCTVEMQLRPTEYVKFGGIFMVGTSSARELILDQREEVGSGSAKCAFGGLQYAASTLSSVAECCPPKNDYFGKDVMATVTVDGNGAHLAYDGGEIVHTNPGRGVAPTLDKLTVGKYGSNDPAKMYVRSVRIYDTALTREQSQWNLFVDRVRLCAQSAFNYSKDQGTLTVSMDCPSPVPYDVVAVVRDLGESWTTVTNVIAEGVVSGPVSGSLPGIDPAGSYEVVVKIRVPVDGKKVEMDVNVLTMVTPESVETRGTIYQTAAAASLDTPGDWLLPASGLRRVPLDGDKVIIGQMTGTYALNITGAGTRTFNGWTGAGAEAVVSETTIGAGSTLNITNTAAYSGNQSGSKASFIVDGGTLHIKSSTENSMYGDDTLTIRNGGTFLRDGPSGYTYSIGLYGNSRIYLQDGNFTITPASDRPGYGTLHFLDLDTTSAFIQSGGTASCYALSFQRQADSYYEISGGSMTLSGGIQIGNLSAKYSSRGTVRLRGSKFTFTAHDLGTAHAPGSRTAPPTFFDYRIRSDADPGAKGVGFIDYNTKTTVRGAIRVIPDGGMAIVHTNLFPLIVQSSKSALTFAYDLKDGAPSHRFWSTGLFDIGVPEGLEHMIRADLKPGAELADGWTSEEGVSAGFVKLPRVVNPDKLLRANLKLKVVPQGTKTLASIKSDLEAMGFGPVTVDETAADYNLVVGLPKDRLAKGFSDSKVLMDFTTVSGSKAMQSSTVTTNALIKAVALDILKPGLILMVVN